MFAMISHNKLSQSKEEKWDYFDRIYQLIFPFLFFQESYAQGNIKFSFNLSALFTKKKSCILEDNVNDFGQILIVISV